TTTWWSPSGSHDHRVKKWKLRTGAPAALAYAASRCRSRCARGTLEQAASTATSAETRQERTVDMANPPRKDITDNAPTRGDVYRATLSACPPCAPAATWQGRNRRLRRPGDDPWCPPPGCRPAAAC